MEILPAETGSPPLRIRIVGLADDARFSVQPVVFVSYPTFEAARRVTNPDGADRPVFPSAVAVDPAAGVEPEALAASINRAVSGVEALDRDTAVASLPGVQPVSQSFAIILFLAFLVVTLVTGFFFLILTVQKASALALLRAIGASGGSLVRALLIQVVLVVVGGIIVGTALVALASLGSSPTFPISIESRTVLGSGTLVLVLALLSSLVAVRRVLRVDPVDAVSPPAMGGFA